MAENGTHKADNDEDIVPPRIPDDLCPGVKSCDRQKASNDCENNLRRYDSLWAGVPSGHSCVVLSTANWHN